MYQKKTADSHMCNFCVLFLKSLQTFMVRKTTFFWEKKKQNKPNKSLIFLFCSAHNDFKNAIFQNLVFAC